MSSKTRTVAYLRVSTTQQAQDGVSLDAQEAKAKMYAELYDLEVVEFITDPGVSAKTLERPGLKKALELLDQGHAEALLVVKLDRLTRSVRDLGWLLDNYFAKKDGPALLCVAEQVDTRSAAGRLVLNVLMSVAQWERETTAERTSSALQHKASIGEYTGGKAPYGWKISSDGVKLDPDPTEQSVIVAAVALRNSGLSLRAVGKELCAKGLLPRSGNSWHASSIKVVLAAKVA